MSFEAILSTSLLTPLGDVARKGIDKLIDSKIIVHRGLTFYHRSSEFEFVFLISTGPEHSKLNEIIKKIQSHFSKPLKFENVIEVLGYGIPHNENLKDLHIIQEGDTTATIDFGRILTEVKSETVFLKIRIQVPPEIKQFLVASRIDKTSIHYGMESIETDIEIALDYSNLWNKVFDEYTVRDIEFTFNLEVMPLTIIENIPKKYRERIIRAGQLALSGNQDAVRFLRIMSENFLSFESDKRAKQLLETVSVEPEDKFSITAVTPTMQTMEIAGVGHPVVLPGKMRITLGCRIEGKEITLIGKLKIDLKKFIKILSEISADIENQTNKLKI